MGDFPVVDGGLRYNLYLLSVWLHILAAAVWVGGMLFLVHSLMPALRRDGAVAGSADLFHRVVVRFRSVGWAAIFVLVLTGVVNLGFRGIGRGALLDPEFWAGPYGRLLLWKLALVAVVVGASAVHDFSIGPRATRLWREGTDPARAARLRRAAGWIGRVNLLLILVVILLAVAFVRGLAV